MTADLHVITPKARPAADVADELRKLADAITAGRLGAVEVGVIVLSCTDGHLMLQALGEDMHTREVVGLLEMAKLGAAIE